MNHTIARLAAALLLAVPTFAAAQTQTQTQTQTQAVARPLLIVDGVVLGTAENSLIQSLFEPSAITSLEVVKGPAAVKLYGERAVDGAIVVSLRGAPGTTATPPAVQQGTNVSAGVVIREATAVNRTTPLFIVDGVIMATDRMPDIAPSLISNIEVIKGPEAARLYGTRAANGIVSITTKR